MTVNQTMTVSTACVNHPARPGAWLMPDRTFRCDPCHDEPQVTGWVPAPAAGACPSCGTCYSIGDRLAVLDTAPPSTVCEECIEY